MDTRVQKITLWDNVLPQTVTSSTDATPIVITKATHGYSTGDLIMIQGHATNIAANGIYKIVVLTTSTFQLFNQFTGLPVAGSGAGAGSGGIMLKMSSNQTPYSSEFKTQSLQFSTSGTASLTLKVAISQGRPESVSQGAGGDIPNFGATVSVSNPYSFNQVTPQDTRTALAGGTGIVLAATDVNQNYDISTNLQKYIMPILTAWTAGRVTAIITLSNQQ